MRPALLLFLLLLTSSAFSAAPGQDMAKAADKFLAALTPEQREQAVFEFKDEQRFDWHFVPKPRKGLPFKEMTVAQADLAHALLQSGLSSPGYSKVTNIISLEYVLFDLENSAPRRNAGLYYVSIFGKPGAGAWGWRFEGHHLSLNVALLDHQVLAVTPTFFGANPARVQQGSRQGLRALGQEEDLARELAKSLDAKQQKRGIFDTQAPRDIITGNTRKAKTLEPRGIPATDLTKDQKDLLRKLIKEYVFRYRAEVAESDLKKIEQHGEDKLYFAWAGGLEPGQGHYYRIQGPSFLMEYDNTQNNANHVHTVWRDFENDFGDDLLRKHYEQHSHPK